MYKSILTPLDGSKLSECSLEHIKAIATGCRVADVVLLTVVEEAPVMLADEATSHQAILETAKQREKEKQEIQRRAEGYLAKIASNLKQEGLAVRTAVVRPEIAHGVADAILDYVRNSEVDLIVMSTHGRSGVSRWAFGSVTDRVVRHATVPVLTIAPAGCRVS